MFTLRGTCSNDTNIFCAICGDYMFRECCLNASHSIKISLFGHLWGDINWLIYFDLKMVHFLLGQQEDIPNTRVSCTYEIVEPKQNTGLKKFGL